MDQTCTQNDTELYLRISGNRQIKFTSKQDLKGLIVELSE